ncbi:MAG: PCP reductase family protein, partial [Acidimicrobiia bacterium]
ARLERIPAALRPMVERGITKHASSRGLTVITPELMTELRPDGATMSTVRPSLRLVPHAQTVPPESDTGVGSDCE